MRIIGIDNQIYKFNVAANSHSRVSVSRYHNLARDLLEEIFPYDNIYEEVTLPGTGTNSLFADFFIPSRKILIEVQGEQHYKYGFFHKNKLDFHVSQHRDKIKQMWCDINQIRYVELPYMETINEWRERIVDRK